MFYDPFMFSDDFLTEILLDELEKEALLDELEKEAFFDELLKIAALEELTGSPIGLDLRALLESLTPEQLEELIALLRERLGLLGGLF